MPEFNPNRIMHGNGGHAWFNGKKLTTLQSVEAKVSGDFEEINVCGDPAHLAQALVHLLQLVVDRLKTFGHPLLQRVL